MTTERGSRRLLRRQLQALRWKLHHYRRLQAKALRHRKSMLDHYNKAKLVEQEIAKLLDQKLDQLPPFKP